MFIDETEEKQDDAAAMPAEGAADEATPAADDTEAAA
ncbi:MAG: hypothetical protein JWO40_766 [Candidatus Doudnabacteria bacterium]|nr:hypothetical protein [Candidatus Doudnabacteria bacterium]